MIYSAGCEHAIRAMTWLACFGDRTRYSQVKDIAPDCKIPPHFLAKIFQILARKGLLESSKGRGGGFRLARDPATIRLADIVGIMDGLERFDRCIIGDTPCSEEESCPHHEQWRMLRHQLLTFLQSQTLADSAEGLRLKVARQGKAAIAPVTQPLQDLPGGDSLPDE